jgi:hypothetical protein
MEKGPEVYRSEKVLVERLWPKVREKAKLHPLYVTDKSTEVFTMTCCLDL